jgi:hypothetical protein
MSGRGGVTTTVCSCGHDRKCLVVSDVRCEELRWLDTSKTEITCESRSFLFETKTSHTQQTDGKIGAASRMPISVQN